MTWHNIMAYAHQGVELRPLPGLPPPHACRRRRRCRRSRTTEAPHAVLLTRKGTDALVRVEHMLDDANRAHRRRSAAPAEHARRARRRRTTAATLSTAASDGDRQPARAATDAVHAAIRPPSIGSIVRLLFGSCFTLAPRRRRSASARPGSTLTRGVAFGALTIGAWTAWPKTGSVDIDPYARAIIARSGELPIGTGDGVAFYARTDDAGQPLRRPLRLRRSAA